MLYMHNFIKRYFWEYNLRKAVSYRGNGGDKQKNKISASIDARTNILVCEEQHFPADPTATRVNLDVAVFNNTLLQILLKLLGK